MAKTTYRVTGGSVVAGNEPGSTFQHEFTAEEEAALIWGGAIKVVKKPTPDAKEEK